jgi:hypothetical protein
MAKKLKHKKLRNTGLIYELLVRQTTSDVLNGQTPKSLDIVKKFFKKGSLLSEELKLFNIILDSRTKNSQFTSEILEAVLKASQKLDRKALEKEKYFLIKEINSNLNKEHFFKTQVKDYVVYACISNLLEYNPEDNPTEYVLNKTALLEHISTNNGQNQLQQETTSTANIDPELKKLTFKLLIEKFNKRWGSLDTRQKSILRHFIFNAVDSEDSRKFIAEEVLYLKSHLGKQSKTTNDKVLQIKLNEVVRLLDEIPDKNFISESTYSALLRSHQLIKELN